MIRRSVVSIVERARAIWRKVLASPRALGGAIWRVDGRRPRIVVLLACFAIVGMYCTNQDMGGDPTSPRGDGRYRPVLARGDGHMLYLMARSTALDGDWVFDNDLARFGDPWGAPRTKTGRKSIIHPLGPALVWTPLIWVAQAGAAAANLVGADIQMHGYTLWHQRFVFLSSALFACGAVLLGRRVAKRIVGGAWGPSYAAVAVLLGTPLTYYATYMPSYAHAMDAFACAGFLAYWALTVGRRDLRRWLVLGALLGVATLVRVQELAMGIVVALEVLAHAVRAVRARDGKLAGRWVLGGALALGVTLVVFLPQLLEWHLVFGAVTELPQGAKYTRLEAPMIGELLWSARNGWFSTTPIAYAAVIGLFCIPKQHRLVGAGLLAAVAIQVYLNSTILDWWGSAAFGQRRLCNVTLPLVVGFAALVFRLGRLAARTRAPRWVWHVLLIVVFGSMVAWNLERVGRLRAGKPAPAELSASCCGAVPAPLRGAASWVYRTIGDPFEFPANAIYAIRHGVGINRWDITVGNYPLVPALDSLLDARLWHQRGVWRIGNPGIEPYLVRGFGPSEKADRVQRRTTAAAATVLVPNLLPYGQRMTLWLGPGGARHAVVKWNGDVVAETELAAWTPVRFDLPRIALHTNELTIESDAGGVAVGDLEVALLPP